MKYQVEERVRVRQWEDMEKEFGLDYDGDIYINSADMYFTRKMKGYCGKVVTIMGENEDGLKVDESKYVFTEEMLEKVEEQENGTIKDSGERTTFETGAVRDMHTGKGRMDLLPFHAILELSKHCENGAIKYEEHNVEKGIPQHSLIDSGMRHLFKHAAGYTDEDHLLAALWNIAWAVNQRETHPELIDVPWKGERNA